MIRSQITENLLPTVGALKHRSWPAIVERSFVRVSATRLTTWSLANDKMTMTTGLRWLPLGDDENSLLSLLYAASQKPGDDVLPVDDSHQ